MAHIVVFLGSVRNNRQGKKVADWVVKNVRARRHTVTLVDPLEREETQVMRRMFKSENNPSEVFMNLQQTVTQADGYIAVTPEYNHSYSGAIKNVLDVFLEEYFFKPFGIVTYSVGGFGGIRAAEHLRCVVAEMGAPAIPTSLAISHVQDVFEEDSSLADKSYQKRIEKFLDEFEWYVSALATARSQGVPY